MSLLIRSVTDRTTSDFRFAASQPSAAPKLQRYEDVVLLVESERLKQGEYSILRLWRDGGTCPVGFCPFSSELRVGTSRIPKFRVDVNLQVPALNILPNTRYKSCLNSVEERHHDFAYLLTHDV